MANTNLEIQIKAFVQGLQQIQQLGQQFTQTGQQASAMGAAGKVAGAGFSGVGDSASGAASQLAQFIEGGQKAAGSLNSLVGYAKTAAAAFVAFAAVSSMKDAADIAARNETLGVTLDIIGKNAGYTTEAMKGYEEELKKSGITTQAARNSMIQMMQAGLELGPVAKGAASQISQLARASQDLAVVSGENSSATLQRMVTNIQQLDVVGLRFMGVVVNLDEAQSKYATTIGKTAGALTQQERQQALLNATMEKAKGLQGAYEASMDTVGKKLASMKRYQEEAAAAIGESLLPAYTLLVDKATSFLKSVQSIAEGINKAGVVSTLLKDSMSAAFDFASALVDSVKQVFNELSPLVESAALKFKAAFGDLDTGGLLETLKAITEAVINVGSVIIKAIGESAPSFRLLFDAVVMVWDSLKNVVKEVLSFGDGMGEALSSGELLSNVLQTLGLLAAGFADGLQVIKAAAQTMAAGTLIAFGGIAGVVGSIVSILLPEMGKGLVDIADKAIDMGFKAAESARKTAENFADGKTYVQAYADKLAKLPKAHEADAEAAKKAAVVKNEGFEKAETKVLNYVKAVKDGKLAGDEAVQQYKKIQSEVAGMAKEFDFTQAQVEKLNKRLTTAVEQADHTEESAKKLGTTMQELQTGLSQAGAAGVMAFNELAKSGKLSSEELYRAFNKALTMETSIQGIKQFREALEYSFKAGKIGAEEYRSALQLVGAKFEELFEKQLKTAKTKEDFQQLTDTVKKMGVDGTLSATQVANALEKISEKANTAKADTQRLASQLTALSAESLKLAQSDTAQLKAGLEVQSAKAAVTQAENEDRRLGTTLSAALVASAKAELAVKQSMANMVQAQGRMELAIRDELLAKQQLENAQAVANANVGDAAAQSALLSAKTNLDAKKLLLEGTRQEVNAAGELVEKSRQTAELAQAQATAQRRVTSELEKQARAQATFLEGLSSVYSVIWGSANTMVKAGYTMQEAAEIQRVAVGMVSQSGSTMQTFFESMGRSMNYVAEQAKLFREQMATASKFEENFNRIKESAVDIASGFDMALRSNLNMGSVSENINKVYQKIAFEAAKISRSATEAADSFSRSAGAIGTELLELQGREEEAAKARQAQRKLDLDMEYRILDIKLKAAEITAKAAGINTDDLKASAADAKAAYETASQQLDKIAKIQNQNIRDEKAKKATDDAKNSGADKKAPPPAQALPDYKSDREFQAFLDQLHGAPGSALAPRPAPTSNDSGRTITVQLANGNQTVNTTLNSSDEPALLDLLTRAKKVS